MESSGDQQEEPLQTNRALVNQHIVSNLVWSRCQVPLLRIV